MSRFIPSLRSRALVSQPGPLLRLFQRTPISLWLLPEARLAGGAGLGEITRWTVATVVGSEVFDNAGGATSTVTADAATLSYPAGIPANVGHCWNKPRDPTGHRHRIWSIARLAWRSHSRNWIVRRQFHNSRRFQPRHTSWHRCGWQLQNRRNDFQSIVCTPPQSP